MRFLSHTHGIEPVLIDIDCRSDLAAIEAEAEKATSSLMDQIESCGLCLLASPENLVHDPCLVEEALSLTVRKIYENADLSGLILTGGTTAYTVCRSIGVKRLQLRQRTGLGMILTQTPDLSGMAIGVKGGSLGDVNTINNAVDAVRSLSG